MERKGTGRLHIVPGRHDHYGSAVIRYTTREFLGGMTLKETVRVSLKQGFRFQISVTDNKRQEKATAHVKVLVETVTDTAFNSAGSLRIQNIDAETFIRKFDDGPSMYEQLRTYLSDKMAVPKQNVAIFSVMSEDRHPPVIQVYFAVRGSPYKSATYLNGVLSQNRYDLEQTLGRGVQIVQVNVDDCVFESCEYGCVRMASADIRPTVWNGKCEKLLYVWECVK